jgi:hypothetical protein
MKNDVQNMDEILVIEGHYGPGVWKDGYYFSPLYVNAHKGIKQVLESGEFEGVPFKVTGKGTDIQVGDTYIAERGKTGVKLLTCKKNYSLGWIEPIERAYSFDTNECIRIELDV